jgi:hypothetical protein
MLSNMWWKYTLRDIQSCGELPIGKPRENGNMAAQYTIAQT